MSKKNKPNSNEVGTVTTSQESVSVSSGSSFLANLAQRWNAASGSTRRCAASLAFCAALFLYLAIRHSDFLFLAQAYDAFFWERSFLSEQFFTWGGGLRLFTSFMVEFFYYPWLGAALWALSLAVLAGSLGRLGRLKDGWGSILIAPALIVVFTTQCGYYLFEDIDIQYLFGVAWGTLAATLSSELFYSDRLAPFWGRYRWIIAACFLTVLGFVLGGYAILAAVLCSTLEIRRMETERARQALSWGFGLLAAFTFLSFIVYMSTNAFRYEQSFARFFFSGLYESSVHVRDARTHAILTGLESSVFTTVWLTCLCGVLQSNRISERAQRKASKKGHFSLDALIAVAAVLGVPAGAEIDNARFKVYREARLLDVEDWDGILKTDAKVKTPIVPTVLFRNLALVKTDRAANDLFKFRRAPDINEDSPLVEITSSRIGGDRVLYHWGRFQLGTRAASNNWVEKSQRSIWATTTLALCASGVGEKALAETYLRRLDSTLFHRSRAATIRKDLYATDAEQLSPNFADAKRRSPQEDFLSRSNNVNMLLLGGLTQARAEDLADPTDLETRLALLLFYRQTDRFCEDFKVYRKKFPNRELPDVLQEGFLFCAHYKGVDLGSPKIKPEIQSRFNEFVQYLGVVRQNPDMKSALLQEVDRYFWDTLWGQGVVSPNPQYY